PIGIEVSKVLGGIPAITVSAIIITGIMGAVIAPIVCKIFKIKNNIAIGISIGTSSHAIGTTKAIEMGETEGAMSSLAIGIAGLITSFLAPIIIKFLH
ncbi:LrgB family protein, partial [Clostridium botulinum]|nr:LrgB family protein [Clostridium botulinum]